ncbi:hypothetical protein A0257_21280 [Hymenobacter psoromatis]|nr:hypothetical protein A0257_21280 [Hymenobacter psoromatis]
MDNLTTPQRGKQPQRIAVIGAGLGGVALARMLHVQGLVATVFDQDDDAHGRSVGGSLDMHEDSGLSAIRQLGLFDKFQEVARFEDQGMRLFDREGNLAFEMNDGQRPEIDRGQLRELLVQSIPADWFRWDHELAQVREAAGGGFELVFHNGQTEHADFVVGADGARSQVRPAVTDVRPHYSGLTFFELEIRNVDQDHPEVAHFISNGLHMAFGENKLISCQRNAAGNARLYASLFVPEDGLTKTGYATVKPRTKAELTEEFTGWGHSLVQLFAAAGDAVRPWPIYTMPIGYRWSHRPGITLLGDAAHVMPPAGEGANLAIRDGVDLACALAAADPDQAVSAYEEVMFARTRKAAAIASAVLLEGSSEDRLALIKRAMSPQEAV